MTIEPFGHEMIRGSKGSGPIAHDVQLQVGSLPIGVDEPLSGSLR